jgi:hypothetical protein
MPGRADLDYVVYFYESGLSRQYLQRPKDMLAKLSYGPLPLYDFSSDLSGRRAWPKRQTVEDVIRSGYLSVPQAQPETALISDKSHTAWLGLDDVISQIRQRYQVYQTNLYEIEISKCSVINSLYTHEAWHGPSDSKTEYSVNKRLDRLYQQQRDERIELWRDVSKLRVLLPENAQEYLGASRKLALLEDPRGDEP